MTKMETDRLVDDYLRRLEEAAAHLQRARRSELVAEIREHIDTALRQEEATSEAAVRNVLERLGPPEEIVAAAEPPPAEAARAGWVELVALVTLLVPFLGWLVGSVLVVASRAWSRRDKVVGGLLLVLPVLMLGLGVTATGPSGGEESVPPGENRPAGLREDDPGIGSGPVELALFAAGVPSALYLGWQLRPERPARRRRS
jgi:hypothetical protein